MKYGPLKFTVVPHENKAFSHHLEVDPFPYDFILSSVPGPFLRSDEELGCSRELVDFFLIELMIISCIILEIQYGGGYTLGVVDTPDDVGSCVLPWV